MKNDHSTEFSIRNLFDRELIIPFGLAAAAVFLVLTATTAFWLEDGGTLHHLFVLIFFLLMLVLSVTLLIKSNASLTLPHFSVFLAGVCLGLFLRMKSMDFISDDFTGFLSQWITFFKSNGGFSAISYSVGDYNVLYQYFLILFSYMNMPSLYLIKMLSILFDFILAFAVMKLVQTQSRDNFVCAMSFVITLLLPTVVLNGSYWAQCDSIYAALALLSLYYGLEKKPVVSMSLIAAAFSFKLQTIFIMPVFLALMFTGRLKIRHLPVFPAVYLLTILPALLLGKPLLDTLGVYTNQIGSYDQYLTMNAPSIFTFFPLDDRRDFYAALGIAIAGVFVLAVCLLLALRRRTVGSGTILIAATIFTTAIPLLLPRMHDRYYFLADVMSIVLIFTVNRRYYLPVLIVGASFGGYYAYLVRLYLFDMRLGTVMLIFAVAVMLYELLADQVRESRLDKYYTKQQ